MTHRKGYVIADQYALHFLTFTIVGWVDLFTRKVCKDIIIDSLKYCKANKGLIINAYVIMESHVYLAVSAIENSDGLSAIIRDLKKHTSKKLLDWSLNSRQESRKEWLEVIFGYHAQYNKNNSKYQIWQQNNRSKMMIHAKFIRQKIIYIHYNPVKARIVDKPGEYLYSSARNYLGRTDSIMEIDVIESGVKDGYVMF